MTTREIELPSGHITIINEQHWPIAAPYQWAVNTGTGRVMYVQASVRARNGKRTTIRLHRLITNAPADLDVDHINHDGLDNRFPENLRLCTRSQNSRNQRLSRNNSSGYKGVTYDNETGLWAAYIGLGHRKALGRFETKEEAGQAYNAAAFSYFGEFALLNKGLPTSSIVAQPRRLNSEHGRGVRADNSSGYKGVSWHKTQCKWTAYISIDGKVRHLGRFDDPWEAAQAYNVAARAAWGDSAFQNKRHPQDSP